MKIERQTNSYTISEELKTMVERFEFAASVLFPEWEMKQFYYGDKVIMVTIKGNGCEFADFNISKNRVSLNSLTVSRTRLDLLKSLTYNDECHNGRLLKLVNF